MSFGAWRSQYQTAIRLRNMKFVWALFALLLVVACLSHTASAAGAQTGICLRPGDSKTFKVGESWSTGPPSKCAKHTCKAPNKISTVLCGAFVIPEGCREVSGNQKAEYPACCPDISCSA